MEEREKIKQELKEIVQDFPDPKHLIPPAGYFEKFPDQVLNRWQDEESKPKTKRMTWSKLISVAAVLSAILVGIWLVMKSTAPQIAPITSAEAYEYIRENIEEFENLLETEDFQGNVNITDLPAADIEEYLYEELENTNAEELF